MADEAPKRKRGRPPKQPGTRRETTRVAFNLPKDDFDYLAYLAVSQKRLGITIHDAARALVIREVATLRKMDYHLKETPRDEISKNKKG
jgi:hypothetical protein